MSRPWEVDPSVQFKRRLGKTAAELGESRIGKDSTELWELDNDQVAIIGRDATASLADRLPPGVHVGPDERIVVIPGRQLRSAKPDIADV